MKKNFFSALCAGIALSFLAGCSQPGEVKPYNEGIHIIPLPQSLTQQEGQFTLSSSTTLAATTPEAKTIAEFFANKLKTATGYSIGVGETGNIQLGINPELDTNDEGYTLDVTAQGVTVTGKTAQGLFYGMQTFLQLLPAEIESASKVSGIAWTAPAVSVKDEPRFGYRGMMIDPCRHFMPVENIKRYIDVLSLFKVNRLHWHLTEDQGWRIEIKKYPKLTEIGAYRDGTMIDKQWDKCDGQRYGGFYTQEEIKEVVAYASSLGITVIPEIDLPGHMVAALASYPELGCTGGPYHVRQIWGVADEVLCPGKEITFKFIEDVLDEVMELFPSEYIHIGGDECPKKYWASCPDCQKRIKALGLKSDKKHTAEQYLQSYVTARVQKYLNDRGRKIIGWDEILEGELAEGATVMSWRGAAGGIEAAKKGFDVIMTPNTYMYFDYYQSKHTDIEPLAIGGYLPVETVYQCNPVDGIPEEAQKHILGVQANLWTEYIATDEYLEYMLLPRMAALSEVQWCSLENKDYDRFKASLQHAFDIYDVMGLNYCKAVVGEYGMDYVKIEEQPAEEKAE